MWVSYIFLWVASVLLIWIVTMYPDIAPLSRMKSAIVWISTFILLVYTMSALPIGTDGGGTVRFYTWPFKLTVSEHKFMAVITMFLFATKGFLNIVIYKNDFAFLRGPLTVSAARTYREQNEDNRESIIDMIPNDFNDSPRTGIIHEDSGVIHEEEEEPGHHEIEARTATVGVEVGGGSDAVPAPGADNIPGAIPPTNNPSTNNKSP